MERCLFRTRKGLRVAYFVDSKRHYGFLFFTTRRGATAMEKSFFNQFSSSEFGSGKRNAQKFGLEWFAC